MDREQFYQLMGFYPEEIEGFEEDQILGRFSRNLRMPQMPQMPKMPAFRRPLRPVGGGFQLQAPGQIAPQNIKPYTPLLSPLNGSPETNVGRIILPFDPVIFNDSSPLNIKSVARTQKAFRGDRLMIITNISSGAGNISSYLDNITVGVNSQLAGSGRIPLEVFQNNSTGVEFVLEPARPGLDITSYFSVSAQPGTGESITVGLTIFGQAIR